MNRLLIVVAAGLVGSGCISGHDTCDAHDVWISWPSFVRVNDAGTGYDYPTACFTDFAQMRVYVNGSLVGTADCTDDAVPVNLLTGSYTVRVDAVDTRGAVVVRDERVVSISDTCATQEVPMHPGETIVNFRYALPGGVCDAEVGSSFMWFLVTDSITNKPVAEQDENLAVSEWQNFQCDAARGTSIILPAGNLDLQFFEEYVALRSPVRSISDITISSASCARLPVDTVAGVTKEVDLTLTATSSQCQ